MDALAVRSEHDRALAEELLADPVVRRIRTKIEEQEGRLGTRRSLLATALRLSPGIAPKLHGTLSECVRRLGVETEVELYVYASPSYNAACTPEEGGRVFVLVSSALLEGFSQSELAFVLGHELGHHRYQHHDIPLGPVLSGKIKVPPGLVLRACSWQRHAEISADRAGLLCCEGFEPAARAFFKLSSGLSRAPGEEEIAAYLEQASELFTESEAEVSSERVLHSDFLASHPFSPIRLRAAQAFCQAREGGAGTTWLEALEVQVLDLLSLMDRNYLDEESPAAEAMRRLLFTGAVLVANADGKIDTSEVRALEELIGAGKVPREVDVELVESTLDARVRDVRERVPLSRRVQLMRDLTSIARADGRVEDSEIKVLEELAARLELGPEAVGRILASSTELD